MTSVLGMYCVAVVLFWIWALTNHELVGHWSGKDRFITACGLAGFFFPAFGGVWGWW